MSLKEEGGRKKEEIQAMQDARVPEGWTTTTLGNLCEWVSGGTPRRSEPSYFGGKHPWITISDLNDGELSDTAEYLTDAGITNSAAKLVPEGSILVALYGSIGKLGITQKPSTTNQAIACALPDAQAYNSRYLFHFIRFRRHELSQQGTGVTQKNIYLGDIKAFTVPLAPLAEQTRIVKKLEELLADLDAGVAELKAAQKKLAQYRQSLLKAAVEGQLTADWRAQHPPTETGAELLARILQERRTRWEAKQLEKFAQQGKTPPKNWQGKYPEPIPPDTRSLPTLPEGWVWATLSQIGWLDRGRSKYRPRNAPHLYGGAYPFVQTGDIRHADTHLSKVEVFYSKAGLTQSRLWPAGTMCITIAANIGKTAILSMDACFPDSIVGFLPVSGDVSVRYVEYFMRSAQQKLEDEAPATAQKNINLEILEKVVIPLPPPIEQQQIVKSLDETMGGAKENNSAIEIVLKQTTAQRQNILRAAFAGELVPQDPSDEPASALLERIRAQRAAQTPDQKPRGRKKKEIQDA